MHWKLWTRDENVRPFSTAPQQFDSKESALAAACDRMNLAHVKVLYIEGPNGEKIEYEDIWKWCKARS